MESGARFPFFNADNVPAGTFSSKLVDGAGITFVCEPCPAGSIQASGASVECIPCKAGEYQDENGSILCKRCGMGEYQDQTGFLSLKNYSLKRTVEQGCKFPLFSLTIGGAWSISVVWPILPTRCRDCLHRLAVTAFVWYAHSFCMRCLDMSCWLFSWHFLNPIFVYCLIHILALSCYVIWSEIAVNYVLSESTNFPKFASFVVA